MWMLLATAVSAAGQLAAGAGAKKTSELNAYNIETERELSKTEALNRHNDRLDQYRSNLSANIASFAAMGRDVGADRSVAAFLEKQKQVATKDTARSDFMGAMEAMKLTSQAAATRAEGRAQQASAVVGALGSLFQGLQQVRDTRIGGSSYAPSSSLRPRARP